MVELTHVAQSEPFHQPPRSLVLFGSERNNAIEFQLRPRSCEHSTRAFGGQAATPGIKGKSPANFDGGGEVSREANVQETDKADMKRRSALRSTAQRPKPYRSK